MAFRNISGSVFCSYKSGDTIISQDSKADYVYFLTEGICCRSVCDPEGNEFIFSIRKATGTIESILGLLLAINQRQTYKYSFIALTDCRCYRIAAEDFRSYINTNPSYLYEVISFATDEYARLVRELIAHSRNSIGSYLCQLILELSELSDDGRRYLPAQYSNDFLSKITGVTAVTIARIMSHLKTLGIISRSKRILYIENESELIKYGNGMPLKYKNTSTHK